MKPRRIEFTGAAGNRLVGDEYGEPTDSHPSVILLHGGGQTRHAWRNTARKLAEAGFHAVSIDQRGHGQSDWSDEKRYTFGDYAADLGAVAKTLREGEGRTPILVGASLGGISGLIASGRFGADLFSALVLVDITPRMSADGVAHIHRFMSARMHDGFASLEEAADSIAEYLPHRTRPRSLEGLKKNLRHDPDGRYRWHWDPAFFDGPHPVSTDREKSEAEMVDAARKLEIPVLLVRGGQSDLVTEEAARAFLDLVPHAAYVDVSGAGHMVAGDRNDVFSNAVIDFLTAPAMTSEDGVSVR